MPIERPGESTGVAQNDSRQLLSQQAFNSTEAAPTSAAVRYAEVTAKGLYNLPAGMVHSVVDNVTHPKQLVEMVATSAVMGAALKVVLPKGGPAGLIAGTAIGGYFLYESAIPIGDAYSKAGQAKTMGELDAAGIQLGDAGGAFVVNSAIGMAGYRLGAGAANKVLLTERMDGFAEVKHNFWNGVNDKISSYKIPGLSSSGAAAAESSAGQLGARSVSIASQISIEGDRASLLYTKRPAPLGKLMGEINPVEDISVTVLAKTKGSTFLMDRYIHRITNGGKALTDAQIESKFGTDPTAAQAVHKFAADHGLAVTDQTHASGRIVLKGSVDKMQTAFGTNLQQFEQNGFIYRGRSGILSVPADVAPHIKGVLGLDNRPQFHTNYVRLSDLPPEFLGEVQGAVGTGAGGSVTGGAAADAVGAAAKAKTSGARPLDTAEVFKAYNAPATDGAGLTTGFLSLGGTMPKGWNEYLVSKGIDPKTFKVINIGETTPRSDPRGANGENALDGVIHKEALPKAQTVMIQAPNNDTGMPNGIDRITFPKPGEKQITHASISWGMYEPGWTAQAAAAMEDAGRRAALKKITITVASGDDGAGDGWSGKKAQVDLPAGLANFTAVGGTQLILKADGSWGSEKTWFGNGATGGGRSLRTPVPEYQKDVIMPDNLNNPAFKGRGVPDIAGNADPRSGWNTFTDQGMDAIGGTSASAPAKAVAAAMISQATGKDTGFWNPTLYRLGKSNPEVYRDITVGHNTDGGVKGYPAGPGWDASTGWGSINIGKMIEVLKRENSQHFIARGVRQVPGLVRENHTGVPAWVIPYQTSVVNDQQK